MDVQRQKARTGRFDFISFAIAFTRITPSTSTRRYRLYDLRYRVLLEGAATRHSKVSVAQVARAIWEGCHEALHRRPLLVPVWRWRVCVCVYMYSRSSSPRIDRPGREIDGTSSTTTVVTSGEEGKRDGSEKYMCIRALSRLSRSLSRWWQFRIDRCTTMCNNKARHCNR